MPERSSSGIPRVCFEALSPFKWWRRRKDRVKGELVKKQKTKKKSSREEDIWRGCWQETKDRARGKVENSRGNLLNICLELTKWEEKQTNQ